MGITVTVLILLTVTLFVLTLVFYGQKNRQTQEYNDLRSQITDYVEPSQRDDARVQRLLADARSNRRSLVQHLITGNRELAALAVGNEELDATAARARAEQRAGVSGGSLLGRVEVLQSQLDAAKAERDDFRRRALAAQEDSQRERDRVNAYERSLQGAVDEARGAVRNSENDVADLRSGVDRFEEQLRRERDAERASFQSENRDLQTQIGRLTQENLVLQDIIQTLRGQDAGNRLSPLSEYALVDGEVIAIDPVRGEAIISLGRSDRLSIGLTFSVYTDRSGLRPDEETGEYNAGKAVIEVVEINPTNARCRILAERRGNPVVAGDIIANPLYDPEKIYKFVVFGSFDTNSDGLPTAGEEARLKALVREWGGQVVDDIQGDLDFLVLGERAVLPPQPNATAPRAVFDEYVRLQRLVERYDDLYDNASEASIPVLNTNRLMTLIGVVPN
jgi:hypothetical protein